MCLTWTPPAAGRAPRAVRTWRNPIRPDALTRRHAPGRGGRHAPAGGRGRHPDSMGAGAAEGISAAHRSHACALANRHHGRTGGGGGRKGGSAQAGTQRRDDRKPERRRRAFLSTIALPTGPMSGHNLRFSLPEVSERFSARLQIVGSSGDAWASGPCFSIAVSSATSPSRNAKRSRNKSTD